MVSGLGVGFDVGSVVGSCVAIKQQSEPPSSSQNSVSLHWHGGMQHSRDSLQHPISCAKYMIDLHYVHHNI